MTFPTLRTIALATIARRLPPHAEADPAAAILLAARKAVQNIWSAGDPFALIRTIQTAPTAIDDSVVRLAQTYRLTPVEILTISLIRGIEDDRRIGLALRLLQAGEEQLTLGLLDLALVDYQKNNDELTHLPSTTVLTGQAIACGILYRTDTVPSLPASTLRMSHHVVLALRGSGSVCGMLLTAPILEVTSLKKAAEHFAHTIAAGGTLLIRGSDEQERQWAAYLVASQLERRAVLLTPEQTLVPGIAVHCWLNNELPVLTLAAGEKAKIPQLIGLRSPQIVLVSRTTTIDDMTTSLPTWRLTQAPKNERIELWRQALGDCPALITAAQLRSSSARIATLSFAIKAHAHAAGRTVAETSDVTHALADCDPGLGSLAVPIRDIVHDDAVVFTPAIRRELLLLELRCKQREQLEDGLGSSFSARATHGARALLVGAPGTGKTLAASWLSTRLGQPLYRVDLAAIASKYIGETEQNLGHLLDVAEAADVMLLFDEADSLFANRTEVRDASDRHANAVVNYLLARLEGHAGIVLLTANSRARFDAAFARRLDAVIEIPIPGPEERRALWRSHLGTTHRLTTSDINCLAAAVDLAGGHIRNVVLTAALLARNESRTIMWDDVFAGIISEYRKLGRAVPAELNLRKQRTVS